MPLHKIILYRQLSCSCAFALAHPHAHSHSHGLVFVCCLNPTHPPSLSLLPPPHRGPPLLSFCFFFYCSDIDVDLLVANDDRRGPSPFGNRPSLHRQLLWPTKPPMRRLLLGLLFALFLCFFLVPLSRAILTRFQGDEGFFFGHKRKEMANKRQAFWHLASLHISGAIRSRLVGLL